MARRERDTINTPQTCLLFIILSLKFIFTRREILCILCFYQASVDKCLLVDPSSKLFNSAPPHAAQGEPQVRVRSLRDRYALVKQNLQPAQDLS